jgi:signal transduction histidine kinase
MQNNGGFNSKTFDFEGFNKSTLPSKEQFYELEAYKSLLEIRPLWVSVLLRLLISAILGFGVPLYLILIWLAVSLLANNYIKHYNIVFAQLVSEKPLVMTKQMRQIVKSFSNTWYINAFVWGCAGILAQIWLSDLPRVLVLSTLAAATYLFIARNCASMKLMNQVSSLILGIPLLGGFALLIDSEFTTPAVFRFLGLAFYLGLTLFLVFVMGERLNRIFKQRCASDYSNLQLIESLEQSYEKLRVEQAALTDANTVIQQFYSAAAHDLRQPVYAMELYTDMLHDDPSKIDSLLPKISQSCMSINAMFNELFDFQQKHLSDVKLDKTILCIADTFKNLALHFEPIAASKNLNISFKPLAGSVTIIPLYLVRILSNLIANAITYTQSGRILVAARKSGEYLSFEIWDTGIGIEKAAQEKIFLEFYQINTTDKKTNNLGLGLAIVKELVPRIEKAKIRVDSMIGHGSVFKLLLPIETYSVPEKNQTVEPSIIYSI